MLEVRKVVHEVGEMSHLCSAPPTSHLGQGKEIFRFYQEWEEWVAPQLGNLSAQWEEIQLLG